ncbi:hypothetical protein WJX73_006133 [Symbiochloris irregularis]|uniref:mannan endo-1,4-beta-mannosidase n=1 Tax=Symbiochloris irregularis TaxID=706552 RepID=A0AAW1NWT5_9CHLO
MSAYQDAFVQVSEDGLHFQVADKPFFFAGANCYYLLTRGADPDLQHEVLEVLDAVQQAGLTVIRTWAFCDGEEWNALQPSPGNFNEQVFQSLDWLLIEARRRGLRLILGLTNYWKAYGGMCQYVKWSCARRGVPPTDKAETFYTDSCCQDIYQNFLATLTNRVNSFTGRPYRDDPTIMAWSLSNEPRCDGDYSGSVLSDWIAVTAEFLKSLDGNHLVCAGSEGFLGSATPELLVDNPYDCMSNGCDFLRNHSSKAIDFATIHLWPDTWMPNADEERKLHFARRWINCHTDLCTHTLRKPLVLTEFGKKPGGKVRAAFYDKVYSTLLHHARAGHGLVGSCCWAIAHDSYPDYDGFTLYLAEQPSQLEPEQHCTLM